MYESAELLRKTVEVALTVREINPLYRGKQQLFLICQTNLLDLSLIAKNLRKRMVGNDEILWSEQFGNES